MPIKLMKRKLYLFLLLLGLLALMFVERLEDFELLIGKVSEEGTSPSFIVKSLFYFVTYSLNALGSVGFLYLLFQDKNITRAASYLYLFGLFVWIPLFILMVQFWHIPGFEFLAHGYQFIRKPVFLFVLIAAFTFLKKKEIV